MAGDANFGSRFDAGLLLLADQQFCLPALAS